MRPTGRNLKIAAIGPFCAALLSTLQPQAGWSETRPSKPPKQAVQGIRWIFHCNDDAIEQLITCKKQPYSVGYRSRYSLGVVHLTTGKLLWSVAADNNTLIDHPDYILVRSNDQLQAYSWQGRQLWSIPFTQMAWVNSSKIWTLSQGFIYCWDLPSTDSSGPPQRSAALAEKVWSIEAPTDATPIGFLPIRTLGSGTERALIDPKGNICGKISKAVQCYPSGNLSVVETATSSGRTLQAYQYPSGKLIWTRPAGTAQFSIVQGRLIGQDHQANKTFALSVQEGKTLWRVTGLCQSQGPLQICTDKNGTRVYSGDTGQLLRQYGPQTAYLQGNIQVTQDGRIQRQGQESLVASPKFEADIPLCSGLETDKFHLIPVKQNLICLEKQPQGSASTSHSFDCSPVVDLWGENLLTPGNTSFYVHSRGTDSIQLRLERISAKETTAQLISQQQVGPIYTGNHDFTFKTKIEQPGSYRLTALARGAKFTHQFQVSEMAVIAKSVVEGSQTGQIAVTAFVHDARSGRTKPGQKLVLRGPNETAIDTAYTDAAGRAQLRGAGDKLYLPSQDLLIPLNKTTVPAPCVYLRTDRPLYRPGQRVHFYGVYGQLQLNPPSRRFLSGQKVQITARDVQDNILYTQNLTSGPNGVFSGQFDLSADPPRGQYRLRADILEPSTPAPAAPTRDDVGHLAFMVSDYRKPPFEILAEPSLALIHNGQSANFKIKCRYFFGSPVANAKIHYTLSSERLYFEKSPDSNAFSQESDYRSWQRQLLEGDLQTKPDGTALLNLPIQQWDSDQRLSLNLTAVASEGQEVTGSSTCLATPAEFSVGAWPLDWVGQAHQPLGFQLRTANRLGIPYSAKVEVEIRSGDRRKKPLWATSIKTGPDGRALATWPNPRAGAYELLARSFDAAGRQTQCSQRVWVAGKEDESWYSPSTNLEIHADRSRYRPGEKARLLVLTSKPGPILLSVEGDRLHQTRQIHLNKRATLLELPLPASYSPGVHCQLTALNPQNPIGTQVYLPVEDNQHRLQIASKLDKSEYKPGETAHLDLSVTSPSRNPVSGASMQIAVVDDALLSLQKEFAPHLETFFYGPRENGVQTTSIWPRKTSVAGFQTIQAPVKIRSEFKDTALWRTQLQTDANGKATVDIPLPDNLTRWKANIQGVHDPIGVGQLTEDLRTNLPLMVRWATPRFLVEGDEALARVVVTDNETHASAAGNSTVEVSTSAEFQPLSQESSNTKPVPKTPALERKSEKRQVQLAKRTTVKVDRALQAPFSTKSVVLEATAKNLSSNQGDGEKQTLAVLPRATALCSTYTSPKADQLDLEVEPSNALGANLREATLTVLVCPTILDSLRPTLEYLADYPYGCAEQTMSRFVPTLAAIEANQAVGSQDLLHKPVDAMVGSSLDTLYGYQRSDGGWGWWKEDATNPFMTGYVLWGLSKAQRAGYLVAPDSLARAIGCSLQIQGEAQTDLETRIYLLWSLSSALNIDKQADLHRPQILAALQTVANDPNLASSSLYGQALLAESLATVQILPEKVRELQSKFTQAAISSDTSSPPGWSCKAKPASLIHWSTKSLTAHGFVEDDLEATCAVVRALACDPSSQALREQACQWILSQRQGERWKSTKDSAAAVTVLCQHLKSAQNPQSNSTQGQVLLDGREIDIKKSLSWKTSLDPNQSHRLQLRGFENTPVFFKLEGLQNPWPDANTSALAATSKGILVSRKYSRTKIAEQETIDVTLTIKAVGPTSPLEFVKIEDPKPAGFEFTSPVGPLPYNVARQEQRDDKIVFFITRLGSSSDSASQVLHYRLRGETPGSYTALPAHAEMMYRPEIWGRSASQQLRIEP